MLTVAVSSRSLFHLEASNVVFEQKGQGAYDAHMRETESQKLDPGVAFDLVRKLLLLNRFSKEGQRLVNVVLLSRNSPDASVRIMRSVGSHGLDIQQATFTAGGDRFRYAQAMDADLFLCVNPADAKLALDNGLAAASILPRQSKSSAGLPPRDDDVVRIALDGDSVLFDDSSDKLYREHGLPRFVAHELEHAEKPLGDGPFKNLLFQLSRVQAALLGAEGVTRPPLVVGLVTARGVQSHGRVISTLRSWGITVDEVIFASGAPKGPLLKAFGADFFFDDTQRHVDSAQENDIAAGRVHFGAGGLPENPVAGLLPSAVTVKDRLDGPAVAEDAGAAPALHRSVHAKP